MIIVRSPACCCRSLGTSDSLPPSLYFRFKKVYSIFINNLIYRFLYAATVAREQVEEDQNWSCLSLGEAEAVQQLKTQGRPTKKKRPLFLPNGADGQRRYSCDEVWALFRAEGDEEQRMPVCKTFYNSINKGWSGKQIPVIRDAQGRIWPTDVSVARPRKILKEWRLEGNVRALAKDWGWKASKFHHFRKRHREKGESPQAIVQAIMSRGRAAEEVEE